MHSRRSPGSDPVTGLIPCLAWLLASLATAAIAHTCIDLLGAVGAGGDAYDEHSHGAVAPIALGALGLIGCLLLRSAALGISRSRAVDPAILLARRFGRMRPFVPALIVTLGGFATLVAMEFTEQLSALGRIEGIADALGGNPVSGLAIIVGVASFLTIVGLRFASTILQATVATAGALALWIIVKAQTLSDCCTIDLGARRRRGQGTTLAFNPQALGLRAPPATAV